MTVREIIEHTDLLYPNAFSYTVKAMWLRELDRRIYGDFSECYPDFNEPSENSYCLNPETQLLADDGFSELYTAFLVMQFDIVNADSVRYANSAALFNTLYGSYMNYVNRTHTTSKTSIIMD